MLRATAPSESIGARPRLETSRQTETEAFRVGRLTLPNHENAETAPTQLSGLGGVSSNVGFELLDPQAAISFRRSGAMASGMPMPEATGGPRSTPASRVSKSFRRCRSLCARSPPLVVRGTCADPPVASGRGNQRIRLRDPDRSEVLVRVDRRSEHRAADGSVECLSGCAHMRRIVSAVVDDEGDHAGRSRSKKAAPAAHPATAPRPARRESSHSSDGSCSSPP